MWSSGGRGEYVDVLEEPSNTETEDETALATRKRRQNNRRVSFADNEITSVHIFKRDDDYDATPPSDQGKSSDKAGEVDKAIGLFRDSQDSLETTPHDGDGAHEEDEDVDGLPGVFFRPAESPSPGSCTVGSFASSIDEDNVFGPVYASLIHQGMLSESPVSNEASHEITMDSTAFSLHFQRLLAKSDPGEDLKTPCTYPLSLEERTPSHRTNSRSSMSLTNTKKVSPQSASHILKSWSAGKDSNAMSLIGENISKYEYGRLSPSLEALLNVSRLGNDASARNHVGSSSPNKEKEIVGTQEASDTITPVHLELVTAKSLHQEAPLVMPAKIFTEKDDVAGANTSVVPLIQTPNQQLNVGLGIVPSSEGTIGLNSLLNVSQKLVNEQDYDRSQMKGSISSIAAKRRQLFANVTTPTKPSATSPSTQFSGSLFEEETARHSTSLSAIWKNISRLKNPDSSPTSAHKIETLAMKLKLSTPLLSSPNKDEAPRSLHLGKPAVSPLTLSWHLLCDDRSGMNTPMYPVVIESNRESTQTPSKKISEIIQSPAAMGSAQNPSKKIHHAQMHNMTKSPPQKRSGETNSENNSPLSKVARLQIPPIQAVMYSELPDDFVVGKDIIRDGGQGRHWKDVLTKFMEDASNWFFPLVDRLDLRQVHILDDMLAHVQTLRKYEVLHSEIQSQLKSSNLRKNYEKRLSDLTLLFSKVAYEKARLLVDHVKHYRLQKVEDLLKYVLQESHKLSAVYQNSLPSLSKSGPHPSNDEIGHGTISSLRQENDRLDQTIKRLCRSISTHGKMKGEAVEVKEHATASLRKRMTSRFVRQDLQAWKVFGLDTAYGSHAITLDYLGLINQRIVVKANPTPSLTVSNELDSSKIEKRFPNMAASTAFAFLFPAQMVEKYARSRSLAPVTQITSVILHNLLDIIEEVQLARLQIDNLVDASFHAYAAGQLHLLLSFIGFNKDRKLTLTLDMTCLIRGVYPSEIRPHNLEAVGLEKEALEESIKAAIEVVIPGLLRIMNICECVSKAMEI